MHRIKVLRNIYNKFLQLKKLFIYLFELLNLVKQFNVIDFSQLILKYYL